MRFLPGHRAVERLDPAGQRRAYLERTGARRAGERAITPAVGLALQGQAEQVDSQGFQQQAVQAFEFVEGPLGLGSRLVGQVVQEILGGGFQNRTELLEDRSAVRR